MLFFYLILLEEMRACEKWFVWWTILEWKNGSFSQGLNGMR